MVTDGPSGLFARACLKAQAASPTFTHVYAALVAIVNTKFPQNGELVLKRLVSQARRAFRRNDKVAHTSTQIYSVSVSVSLCLCFYLCPTLFYSVSVSVFDRPRLVTHGAHASRRRW